MSQHDYNLANAAGAAFRADANSALGAIATRNSGATAPSSIFAYQVWVDTTSGTIKHRNAANSGWLVDSTADESFVLSRSSNTPLDVSDWGKTIIATSTFTQTLDAAATLTDGWSVNYRNDGTGIITIDPSGAETIDGATTINLYTGESCTIFCNGSAFKTTGRSTGEVLIETRTASSQATLDFTVGIDSSFDVYVFQLSDVVPVSSPVNFYVRASTNGGSSFLSTNEYDWATSVTTSFPSGGSSGVESTAQGILNNNGANADFFSGRFQLHAPSGTSRHKAFFGQLMCVDTGGHADRNEAGVRIKTTSAVNAIRFLFSSGNILTGKFSLYGIRK